MQKKQSRKVNECMDGLEARQTELYRRDGFILVPGVFSSQEIATLSTWVEEVEQTAYPPNTVLKYYEEPDNSNVLERRLRRAENFSTEHGALGAFVTSPPLLELAGQLFGTPAVLFKDKINYKHPGGGGYYYHRDGRWWWRDAQGNAQKGWEVYAKEFLTALVCIDDSDLDNGCIEFAAGLHTADALGDEFAPLSEEEAKAMDFQPCPARAGDVVFFHALLPHGSGANKSHHPRRSLYLTYNRAWEGDHRERYFSDKMTSASTEAQKSVSERPVDLQAPS